MSDGHRLGCPINLPLEHRPCSPSPIPQQLHPAPPTTRVKEFARKTFMLTLVMS